ncbi:MAG: acetate kinase, partial [Nanoarchaeota archaeon]
FNGTESAIKSAARKIDYIAVRIVAPGEYFQKNRIIDGEFMKKIEEAEKIAPLHVRQVISEIHELKKKFPRAKMYGISDSEFHSTIPEKSKVYGIDFSDTKKYGIYRYGYHGISTKSVLKKIPKYKKIIVCHLGGGSSVTAVLNGKSIDTSMGFSPLSGLIGTTRAGDLDFQAIKYLAAKKKMSFHEMENYLNFDSGFVGLCGEWDFRKISKRKDKRAKLTLELFTHKIKKQIGSYVAAMNGVDAIVFTGAIGFGSSFARKKICENLDMIKKAKILVVESEEERQMFDEVRRIL